MDLLIVTTESHRALADQFFYPTMPADSGMTIREKALGLPGRGSFEDASWQKAVNAKLHWMLEYLDSVPDGTPFAFSDVDIQFFPGFSATSLASTLDDSGVDILFQKERRSPDDQEVNTGFYVARITPWVRNLFAQAAALCDGQDVKKDQDAINELLTPDERGKHWDHLPLTYYARSHGFPPGSDIVLHHANFSFSIPEKVGGLRRVRAYVTGGTLDKVKASAGERASFVTSGKLTALAKTKLRTVRSKVRR